MKSLLRLRAPRSVISNLGPACSLVLAVVGIGTGTSRLVLQAQERSIGQPSISGIDPSQQAEADWVDNRWSRTDVGQFMSSNIRIRGSQVLKGLSIKIGGSDEAAVCFDTSRCQFRAAWVDGFLDFAPARFGLIRPPRIQGEIAFGAFFETNWNSNRKHYRGLHLNGRRVVLEYRVDETRILDTPWFENTEGLPIFSRTIELAPHSDGLSLLIRTGDRDSSVSVQSDKIRAVAVSGNKVFAVSVIGSNIHASKQHDGLVFEFPPSNSVRRFKLLQWVGNSERLPHFNKLTEAPADIEDLERLSRPGPARWLPELITAGQRGFDTGNFAVDTLTVPYDNPWEALMFLSGVGFTADGTAYVSTLHGDVWRIRGIDENLRELRWKRFATGLFQPLGLQVRGDEIFVLGRDQITRLHDHNNDGEADFYENFTNLIETRPGHSYVAGLEQDNAGNFYYVDPLGVHRVSQDGLRKETLATGFRNPNGLGVSPDGKVITVAPQQGGWTPSSEICEIALGGYYGFGGPKTTETRPLGYDAPLCWIPHRADNSSGSQVWIAPNHWGPLEGRMLHLLWGRCGIMMVLRDLVEGMAQGAVVPLPIRFLSGPHRGVFYRGDGNLYVAGSTGWQTSAIKDGALQRVRFVERPVYLPVEWRAHTDGIAIRFSQALNRETVEDPESYAVYQWNYRYARDYGSKDWSVSNPAKEGRDEMTVQASHLSSDQKTVFLEIPNLRPVMQMEIKYNIDSADGNLLQNQIWLTLNRLAPRELNSN